MAAPGVASSRVAFGPCLVTDAAALEAAGGFEAVRDSVIEDVALAQAFCSAGRPVQCLGGGATVVGDIVYYSNWGKKTTTGLGVRTGRKVFSMGRGAFNPVISDGRTIFLTGYSTLYALRPR